MTKALITNEEPTEEEIEYATIFFDGWNAAVKAAAAIARDFDIQGSESIASQIEALDIYAPYTFRKVSRNHD